MWLLLLFSYHFSDTDWQVSGFKAIYNHARWLRRMQIILNDRKRDKVVHLKTNSNKKHFYGLLFKYIHNVYLSIK